MKIKRILCCIALAVCATLAQAQNPPAAPATPDPATLTQTQIGQIELPNVLYRLAGMYKQGGDITRLAWTLQRLSALLPNSGDLKLGLASVYAQQGDSANAYNLLLGMQKQGFGYDLADNPAFANIAGTKVWSYVVDSLKANLKPFGEGKIAFTLPKGDYLFESLAYDPKRKQFLVGSVREGKIYLVDKDGKLRDFIAATADNGLWSVYAMAVDTANDALYVASTSSVYFKNFKQDDFGKAGVFKFKLSTGKLVQKYLLTPDQQPRTMSSIAVGADGQVFAADGLRNIIYRLDGGTLKPMVENPKLTSIRGLAVSGDGKRLYFADYTHGVLGVDLAAGKGFDLDYASDKLVLGGIDGLYWYDDALIVIESGMSPRRVMRLRLDADGRRVATAMPLDAGNPAMELPTYGAIDGDGLYFIANSQKNAYDAYGVLKGSAMPAAVTVFRSNMRFAWDKTIGTGQRTMTPPPMPNAQPTPNMQPAPRGSGLFDNVEGGAQTTQSAAVPSGR